MSRTYGKAQDLIDFTRASGGTALRRVKYGAELVTNGTFDSDTTGWTSGGGSPISVVAGELSVVNPAYTSYGYAGQSIATEVGKVYQISVYFNYIEANGLLRIGTVFGGDQILAETLNSGEEGLNSFSFIATTTTTYIRVGLSVNTANLEARFDNVSVKEVTFDTSDGDLILFNHPNNIPRIEYDADGNLLGLLVEESRTNLITYSESFDNSSYWTLLNSSLESGYSAPDGSNNAYLITASNTSYYVYRAGVNIGLTTISMFMKAGTSNIGGLYSTGGISCVARFNLSTGTVDFTQDCTATITAVGNGWYRCSATYTNTSTGNMGFFMPNTTAGDSVYIFGFQSEAGAFPTSYVPSNSGSTTTRSADVASIDTSAFGENEEAGTFVVEFDSTYAYGGSGYSRIFEYGSTSTNAQRINFFNSEGNDDFSFGFRTNDVVQASGVIYANTEGSVSAKTGFSYKKDLVYVAADGSIIITDTSADILPNQDRDLIKIGGSVPASTDQINGHIKSLKYYPRALTESQLEALTA